MVAQNSIERRLKRTTFILYCDLFNQSSMKESIKYIKKYTLNFDR